MRFLGAVLCAALFAGSASADIVGARYVSPTDVYGHGVVPGGEYAGLEVTLSDGRVLTNVAQDAVYEDVAPRLVDLDGDGNAEVISVVSYLDRGAAVRIWDEVDTSEGTKLKIIAETPPIGTPHRWLGVVGAADLDGDGAVEIAYVDRPHLAKTLRIWRFKAGKLSEIAQLPGVSNHKIGWPFIAGGLRECGAGPEMVLASGDWRRMISAQLRDGQIVTRDLGAYSGPDHLNDALTCN